MPDFTYKPSTSSRGKDDYVVTKMQYGDRYAQRAKVGINATARSWDLTFKVEDGSRIREISDKLASFGGMAFTWVQPWPFDDLPESKWTCDGSEFEYEQESGRIMALTCTFVQAFVP